MPRLSVLDLSGVSCDDSFMAFLRAAQRHLQARQHMTAAAGYSAAVLRSVDSALLAACLPHLQRFEGELRFACGAQCLRALAHTCPLQQLTCSLDQCDEATVAAIGACTTLRGLKLVFRWYPETEDADVSSTQTVVDGLLLPALAGLTRLTSLEVASKEIHPPSLPLRWPALVPLAALTALQRLRLSFWGLFDDHLSERLSQLPAGSLSALTQLRLHGTTVEDMECEDVARVNDAGLAALARAAPALQELDVNEIMDLDEEAPGSAPPWNMPHLTTLTITPGYWLKYVSVVCAAALLARAPRLRGIWAMFKVFSTDDVPLETHLRALAHIAAAGRGALGRLDMARLPRAAELQAAMATAAPGGIALEVSMVRVYMDYMDPAALDDQQVAWLRSVVAGVDLLDIWLASNCRASALSQGIFALPAAAFRLHVPFQRGGGCSGCLLEAMRFAVEAARPGQHVCVWAEDRELGTYDYTDAIAGAEAIAHGALDKDIRVQIGGPMAA